MAGIKSVFHKVVSCFHTPTQQAVAQPAHPAPPPGAIQLGPVQGAPQGAPLPIANQPPPGGAQVGPQTAPQPRLPGQQQQPLPQAQQQQQQQNPPQPQNQLQQQTNPQPPQNPGQPPAAAAPVAPVAPVAPLASPAAAPAPAPAPPPRAPTVWRRQRRPRPEKKPGLTYEFPLEGTNVDPWAAEPYLNQILGGSENWEFWCGWERMTLRTNRKLEDDEKDRIMELAGPTRL